MANVNKFYKFPPERKYLLQRLIPSLYRSLKEGDNIMKIKIFTVISTLLKNTRLEYPLPEINDFIIEIQKILETTNEVKNFETTKSLDLLPLVTTELTQDKQLIQSALKALASLSANNKDAKNYIINKEIHKRILILASNEEARVRVAACCFIAALIKDDIFAMNMLDNKDTLELMTKLIHDKYLDVEIEAMSALCNMSIDAKRGISESETCLTRIIALMSSKYTELKYRSIFLLKNLFFRFTLSNTKEQKEKLLSMVKVEEFMKLFDDEDIKIQEQAICTMRNIVIGDERLAFEQLTNIGLVNVLQRVKVKIESTIPKISIQALYLLSSLAFKYEEYKIQIVDSSVLSLCVSMLDSMNNKIIKAVLSFVSTILKRDKEVFPSAIQKLKQLGIENKLKKLTKNPYSIIKEKAIGVLSNLN